jgi:hypothetical protein
MRKGIAFVVGAVGLGALAYIWTEDGDPSATTHRSGSQQQQTATRSPAPASDAAADRARVFSAKSPLLTQSEHLADQTSAAPGYVAPAGRWASVSVGDEPARADRRAAATRNLNTMTSSKPGDEDARQQLVRDIQYELRRVGCYDGEVHGSWSPNTRKAMKAFTDRVNASLPVETPDYILLTLVQSHKGMACGSTCPAGQAFSADGRCLPRAVLAQQSSARGRVAAGEEKLPGPPAGSNGEPLPGRMTVGVPPQDNDVPGSAQAEGPRGDAASHQSRMTQSEPRPEGPYLRPFGPTSQPAPQNRPRSPYAAKGSTRKVFANTAASAP